MQIKDFTIDQQHKELTKHRTTVLPIACYRTTISHNINGHIPLHWHEEFQFVLVVKGQAMFHIQEDKVIVNEGDGLFINSGRLHQATDYHDSGCVYICLNVSPSFVVSQELFGTYVFPYIEATNLPYLVLHTQEHWAHSIAEAIMEIDRLIEQRPAYYELDITIQLAHIWKGLLSYGFPLEYKEGEMLKNRIMKDMLDYIHQHFAVGISLEDIAGAGQLSRAECCRYFKRFLKRAPVTYVMDYRIQQSLLLLQRPENNVTDVAYQVGFNSTSYFIYQFGKAMNMTPLAYRKQKIGGMDTGQH